MPPHEDWKKGVLRVADEDPLALIELSRLVTRFLKRFRAFDYQDEWDDLIQEVVLSTLRAVATHSDD